MSKGKKEAPIRIFGKDNVGMSPEVQAVLKALNPLLDKFSKKAVMEITKLSRRMTYEQAKLLVSLITGEYHCRLEIILGLKVGDLYRNKVKKAVK